MLEKSGRKRAVITAIICTFFIALICFGCGSDNGKLKSDKKEDEECINNSYKIGFAANTPLDEGKFKVLCPYIEFEEENSSLEEKINDNLRQASTSWVNKRFIKESKNTYYLEVFCHTSRFLSVGQSYETDNFITNDYITIDLVTGRRIFLKDIITDEKKLAQVLHEGKIMTTSRNAFTLDQDEADAAVRQWLREAKLSKIEKILQQCSLEQKKFRLLTDKKNKKKSSLPFVHERPNFYLQNDGLVIEKGEWHSQIILKFKDIDYLLNPQYKKYLTAVG